MCERGLSDRSHRITAAAGPGAQVEHSASALRADADFFPPASVVEGGHREHHDQEAAMTSTTVEDLMIRNILGVFGERDAAARAAAIAELYAPDVVLHLGAEAVHGTQALDEH